MDVYWGWPAVFLLVLLDNLRCLPSLSLPFPPHPDPREDDSPIPADACDWTIWDDTKEQKGVHSVFGRCAEGHIDWRHPYGAVRILLQLPSSLHPTPPPGAPSTPLMQACFRAKSRYAITKISLETDSLDSSSSSSSPSSSHLTSLVILNQTHPQMERELCFSSVSTRPIGLYLEAQSDFHSTVSGQVELDYDIQRTFKTPQQREKLKFDDMEDCRPCTDAEILESACSSDFVVQGTIDTVLHNPEAGESQVQVFVDKIHRQRHLVFKRSASASLSEHSHNALVRGSERTRGGEVIVPHKCGIKEGQGEFLFMGRMRLKRALLKCAPRLEDFESLWQEALSQGVNPCTLD